MDIWHVENKEWTQLRLWRINSDHFRVIEAGTYAPILTNAAYTLMDKKYSSVFKSLGGQVMIAPVTIHDFLIKTKSESYVELNVLNDVRPETISTLDGSGQKLWKCGGNLFVSASLKEALLKRSGDDLAFSLGFSMFGGVNADAGNTGF